MSSSVGMKSQGLAKIVGHLAPEGEAASTQLTAR
jgi:hypothetical protein